MAALNEAQFEKKLLNLKDTQESISGLSSWCLQQPHNHKKIVQIWLQVLKKVKIEQRLTLFYLANDVIQYSKRKGYDFVESWGTALQRATTMVRGDDRVRNKVLRLFTIWDERNIYDESFLVDLVGLLSSRTPAQTSVPDAQDFQPSTLIAKIRSCKQLEDETDLRLKIVNECHLQLSDADALRCSLKDRRHGEDVIAEVEEGIGRMQKYIDSLTNEVKDRAQLIEQLDLADAFYETQKGEARIVCNAYRNFGNRVKTLKRKLDDLKPTLPSPPPSPDVNAPSPSPESDIQLPDEVNDVSSMGMTSFIGSMVIPDTIPEPYVPPQLAAQMQSHSALEEVPLHGVPPPKQQQQQPPPPSHYQVPPPTHYLPHTHTHQPPPSIPTPPASHPPHHMRVPHHLNNSMDFPMNGSASFMNRTSEDSPAPPFLDSTSSFIGNANFSFDFMKDESDIHNSSETPASPPPDARLPDDGVNEFSAPTPKEGNPIEVISSNPNDSAGFSLSEFLKNLIPSQNNSQTLDTTQVSSINSSMVDPSLMIDTSAGSLPLNDTFSSSTLPIITDQFPPVAPPLPPPPPMEEPFPEKLWNSSTLPPKFPSWNDSQTNWGETPQQQPPPPPQESYKEPFLFDVPPPSLAPPSQDRDMRLMPKNKIKDIDHRNLISLTGSPRSDSNSWQNTTPRKADVDLRRRTVPDNRDIVESIDMDLSDDDDNNHSQPLISSTPKNALNRSPLKQPPPPPLLMTPVHQAPPPNHRSTPRNISNSTMLGPSISFNIAPASKLVKESPLKESEEQPKKKLPLLHDVHSTPSPPVRGQRVSVSPGADLVFTDIGFPAVAVLPDLTAPPPPPPPFPPLSLLVNNTPSPVKTSPPQVTSKPESKSDQKFENNVSGVVTPQRRDSVPAESLLKTPELFLEEVLNAEADDDEEPNDVDAAAMLYEDLYDESMDGEEVAAAGEDLLKRVPPPTHGPPYRGGGGHRGGQMWRPPRRGMFPPRGMRPPPPHLLHLGPAANNTFSPRQMGGPRAPFQWRPRFPKW